MTQGGPSEELARRRQRATDDCVADAVRSALCEALVELAGSRGVGTLDAFLARRLTMVEALRAPRAWEPAALKAVRERDAAAIEAALRDIVGAARDRCGATTGPA